MFTEALHSIRLCCQHLAQAVDCLTVIIGDVQSQHRNRNSVKAERQQQLACQSATWPLLTSGSLVEGSEGEGRAPSTGGWDVQKPICDAQQSEREKKRKRRTHFDTFMHKR